MASGRSRPPGGPRTRAFSRLGWGLLALILTLSCDPGEGSARVRGSAGSPVPGGVSTQVPAAPAGFARGMNLEPIGGYGGSLDPDRLADTYRELLALGVDHVALIPSFFQERLGTTELVWHGGRRRVEEVTRTAIRRAHEAGLRVLLKPHLWLADRSGGAWRGDILPSDEQWPAWRRAYRDAILSFARMAAEEQVAAISIGSELTDLALARPEFWRELAGDVRALYPGTVTYAANWDREFDRIVWWDAVDAIGVDAFWPLLERADETPSDSLLEARLARIAADLGAASRRAGRPVVLTEIGYKSAPGAAFRPWEWHAERGESADPELQRRIYSAIARQLNPVAEQGWLQGAYFWVWYTNPAGGGLANSDFTPRGKPAADVLAAWFTGR